MAKQTDHDLLIRIDQQMTDLKRKVDDLGDGTLKKINELEARVRSLENTGNISQGDSKGISSVWKMIIGGMGIIIAILSFLLKALK